MSGTGGNLSRRYERYVAVGDSTTEGLDDPDGRGGYRGWADRLAERIAAIQGGLLYANLGVRGKTTRQIRDEQLERALAMRPDLVTLTAGTNDLLRLRFDAAQVAADVEAMERAFIAQGATVLTFNLPDLVPVMPLAHLFAGRARQLADALRDAAARSGALLIDFYNLSAGSDPRLWSDDRLHANALGHERTAHALAHTLGLPGADASWKEPLPPLPLRGSGERWRAEWRWVRDHFAPWVGRHARGRSSGDGRACKRPELRFYPAPDGAKD